MYLADGSTMNLETIISVPVKIDKITFIADLYVLKVDHIYVDIRHWPMQIYYMKTTISKRK